MTNPLKGIPLPPAMESLPPAEGIPPMDDDPATLSDPGGSDDDLDEPSARGGVVLSKEQKLTQRMQRKAESARVARLRKKEYVSGLEAEVAQLRAELTSLRASGVAQAPSNSDPPTLKEEGQRHRASMEALLEHSALDALEVNATEATVEKYVSNKRAQQVRVHPRCWETRVPRRAAHGKVTLPSILGLAGNHQRISRLHRGHSVAGHAPASSLLRC